MAGTAVSSRLGGGRGLLSPCAGPAAATLHQVRFIPESRHRGGRSDTAASRHLRTHVPQDMSRGGRSASLLASSFGAKFPQRYSESGKGDAAIKSQALGLL
jgi:hypothetical protein